MQSATSQVVPAEFSSYISNIGHRHFDNVTSDVPDSRPTHHMKKQRGGRTVAAFVVGPDFGNVRELRGLLVEDSDFVIGDSLLGNQHL